MVHGNVCFQLVKSLYLWLALAFVTYILWTHSSDFGSAFKSELPVSLELISLCLGLSGISYVCRALRWLGYIRLFEKNASTNRHITVYLAGFAFTASPGKVGELMRASHLKQIGVPFHCTFLSFVSERTLDVFTVSFLGTYFLAEYFDTAYILMSVTTFIMPFLILPCLDAAVYFLKKKSIFF